jgi:dihydrofolate synthase/folylpolyglutamate synthase
MSNSEPLDSRRQAALELLNARIDFERLQAIHYRTQDFKLERMRELLHRLGDPQNDLTVVHVAGTKGKGSTSAMVAAAVTAAGFRVGLFTSPHLERMEERIAINGQPCSSQELVDLIEQVRPAVEAMDRQGPAGDPTGSSPTYFEILTAIGLLLFRARQVDLAVLEVGLGGRLDSTNVCRPAVSVITSISYDHTRQLGTTLEQIAGEKAGIIKPGVPVVSGVTGEGPRQVIIDTCRRLNSPLIQLDVDFRFSYRPPRHLEQAPAWGELDYQGDCPNFRASENGTVPFSGPVPLGLPGRHQAANAAVALAVLDELAAQGWKIPAAARRAGLANVSWPARVEVVARHPVIVIDAAHNTASVEALLECLDESFSARRRLLLFATTRDKDLRGMLSRLLGRFDTIVLTQYRNNPRAAPAEELRRLAYEITGRELPMILDPAVAWAELRRQATADDLLCVTGSFFIAAEVRQFLRSG